MRTSLLIGIAGLILIASVFIISNKNGNQTRTDIINTKPSETTQSAGVLMGKTVEKKNTIPLPQERDIVNTFFNIIQEKRPSDAAGMMKVSDDSEKQAWAVQFNAISSVKVLNIEPSMQEDWTDTNRSYKVTLDITMDPSSANAPIPYYGWDTGQNIRWITLEKSGDIWEIATIATGP
jgi:hypothetical protein